MRKKNLLGGVAVVAVILAMVVGSVLAFKGCYSEHRDMGFSRLSSVISCSG